MIPEFAFNDRPFIVIWEATQACALACQHCRAAAQPKRHPLELTTRESLRLIDQIAAANPVLFVITGGDPVQRPDLNEIIAYAAAKGLRIGLTPSATPDFLKADCTELKRLGVQRIALSIDGATAATHDAFRGVPGTWDWTMQAIEQAHAAGLPVQINTTISRQNLPEFDALKELLRRIEPVLWSVFQLVPTGRGKAQDLLSADEMEGLFLRLYYFSLDVPFDIKTTEGPHFRRVLLQHRHTARPARAPVGINDGKGFVFVSHLGEIFPSGFLPISAGNVRRIDLGDVYRESEVFKRLRDTSLLKGKCGCCEYRNICGGSRARAYALTGDYLAADPSCNYEPRARNPNNN